MTRQDQQPSLLAADPADNHGFIRLNWRAMKQDQKPILVLTPVDADAAPDFVEAIRRLGLTIDIWPLDTSRPLTRRAARGALDALFQACSPRSGVSAIVAPFDRYTADLARTRYGDSYLVLLADDLVALSLAAETNGQDFRRTALDTARTAAAFAAFVATVRQPTLVASLRKAKEYPDKILAAFADFANVRPDDAMHRAAALALGRPHAQAPRAPLSSAIAADLVNGSVEPVHKNGVVTGWAKRPLRLDPLEVRILHGSEELARGLANEFRADLTALGHGDGCFGFRLSVPQHMGAETLRLQVRTVEPDQLIGEVDMTAGHGLRVVAPERSLAAE